VVVLVIQIQELGLNYFNMALTKLDKNLLGFSDDTDFVKLPSGTTAQRPGSPAAGQFRFNTTIGDAEVYDGTAWQRMGIAPPTFSSVDYPGDDTALDPAGNQSLIINGGTFNTGITVTIGGTTPSSITRNSASQLTVTTPAKSAGTYNLVLTNTDGGTATASNAISYNGIPAFSNAAGTLGTFESGATVSVSAAATEPDGGAIGYTITSGALPTGLSINASTGAITGTAGSVSSNTTSNFTVTATDNENQSAARAYSITITNPQPSDNFGALLWTGNNSNSRSVTGLGFKPDLVWIKRRGSSAESHALYDSSRGANKQLSPDSGGAEATNSGSYLGLSSFDNDGFNLGNNGGTNRSPHTYVGWCWKANGGTTSSNSDGTITTTVQTNNTIGFSIITFTGNGTAGATVGHGLGAVPHMFIFKKRSSGSTNWRTYHKDMVASNPQNYNMEINGNTYAEDRTEWNDTAPTSTVISVSSHDSVNESGSNYVCYAFTSKTGFSKFGYYTGNGNSYGPIVNTGFEPAFLMIKRSDSADNWYIVDNVRSTTNKRQAALFANLSDNEYSTYAAKTDFFSNGFQIVSTDNSTNANNGRFVYMAFAADADTTTPTLADSFGTINYQGDGNSSRVITGLDFKPNLIWNKQHNGTTNHVLTDNVTGIDRYLTPSTNAEAVASTYYASFNSNGWTMGNNHLNANSNESFINWCFKANGNEPTINTEGTYTSIVSANQNAGFSIVRYAGTSSAGTVGHGLGAAPEVVIVKRVNGGSGFNWVIGHTGMSWTGNETMTLDNNGGPSTWNYFNATAPTSTVFSLGAGANTSSVRADGGEYIAYCFRSISGFSKFGSYTSNAGTKITTGFEPDFMIFKYKTGGDWYLQDMTHYDGSTTGSNGGKLLKKYFVGNTSAAGTDVSTGGVEVMSDGFYPTNWFNTSNGTIYFAWKQN